MRCSVLRRRPAATHQVAVRPVAVRQAAAVRQTAAVRQAAAVRRHRVVKRFNERTEWVE